ncbi:unnamed protein product [Rotaria magnacalcarata]|uniref:Uncharacterized protein n=1 Tax=Rotaria magnacalcarata TaxID=392030 RepID=A0A816MTP5_9BILA|nr:unnamed protein product [Rotaria magnacalcarata]
MGSTFKDTNTYESETKLSTTTSRTYAQVARGAEIVKRPETSTENPKQNKQINVLVEAQEISPIVGKIYKLRYILHELFGIHDDKSSTVATSSKSSLPKKNNRANKRPCLVIRKSATSVNVLLITRFHHLDPTSEVVLSQLSRENLLKYLVSIHPAPPIHGRRSVKHTLSQGSSYFDPEEKSYIVLKPITVSLEEEWPTPLPNYIDNDELAYIRDILFNIFMEERDQSMETSKIIRSNSEDKDNEDNSTTSSSSSLFPNPRFLQESFGHIDLSLNRSTEIEKWLADVESSPECIIDLNDELN